MYRLRYVYVLNHCFCISCLRSVFGIVGDWVCQIYRAKLCRGTGLVWGRWCWLNAHFFGLGVTVDPWSYRRLTGYINKIWGYWSWIKWLSLFHTGRAIQSYHHLIYVSLLRAVPLFGHLFTLQLGDLCAHMYVRTYIRTYLRHQQHRTDRNTDILIIPS